VDLAGRNVLVVGMARSGLAAVELLLAQGARVTAADARPAAEMPEAAARLAALGVPFVSQAEAAFAGRDLVVLSPGVPADLPELEVARRTGAAVIGDVELAGWFLKGETIGVTGANGKTTTTALIGHILAHAGVAAQVGGNIGIPPAAMVSTSRDGQWNVLELSSFQLETIDRFRARIAVALNVTPDHLDRHRTMESYVAAKGRLFETQRRGDFAVLNADDAACVGYAARTAGATVWFSLTRAITPGLWLDRGRILFDEVELMPAADVPLRGRHNLENVMAAAAAARLAGAGTGAIAAAVRSFPGVEHRLQTVGRIGGVEYVNDSKATNPDAALKALESFDGPLWVILGGKDKGGDYTILRDQLARKARAALLIGAAAAKIGEQLRGATRLIDCVRIETAVAVAARDAVAGDTVLLAPACASFDQFENFEHRGRVFQALVARLAGESSQEER
jgi:UDP-N-acetylmuramoylalanine--D-glutamate ligase